jgi:hypothetical protein
MRDYIQCIRVPVPDRRTTLLLSFPVVFPHDPLCKLAECLPVLSDDFVDIGLQEERKCFPRNVSSVSACSNVMRGSIELAIGKNLKSFTGLESCWNAVRLALFASDFVDERMSLTQAIGRYGDLDRFGTLSSRTDPQSCVRVRCRYDFRLLSIFM